MNPTVQMLLADRARARSAGDRGIERAITADLARYGIRDPEPGQETTTVTQPERAVPQPPQPRPAPPAKPAQRRGGRQPLPRCAHNKTPGNCTKCSH